MIKKIVKSLKEEPLNGYLIAIVFSLYLFNRFFLKYHTSGWINYFLRCHFNDILCGTLFVAYSNVFLNTRHIAFYKLKQILPFCFFAGLVWEFVAPVFRKDAVSDWLDVFCYVFGGLLYWLILKLYLKSCKSIRRKD